MINNRIRWAQYFLKKVGLIDIPRKGFLIISQKGVELVKKNPKGIKIISNGHSPDSLKIEYFKKEKSSANEEVIPRELEKNEIETVNKVNIISKEVEKEGTSNLAKPNNNNNNSVEKKELETLYKLYNVTENIEKKGTQTMDKLNNITKDIEKKEIQASAKLDSIIENIEKKEIQTSIKLDNMIENVEKKI